MNERSEIQKQTGLGKIFAHTPTFSLKLHFSVISMVEKLSQKNNYRIQMA